MRSDVYSLAALKDADAARRVDKDGFKEQANFGLRPSDLQEVETNLTVWAANWPCEGQEKL